MFFFQNFTNYTITNQFFSLANSYYSSESPVTNHY